MELDLQESAEELRIRLAGEVDEAGASKLMETLEGRGLAGRSQVVLDLGGVTYFGSAGVGKILLLYKTLAQNGGSLRLVNLSREMYEGLKALDLDEIVRLDRRGSS